MRGRMKRCLHWKNIRDRPSDEAVLNEFADTFDLSVNLCTIDDFGGWDKAYEDFFADDAIFDEIYSK